MRRRSNPGRIVSTIAELAMCGIAAEIRWDGPARVEVVARMLQRLASRGPDGSGIEAMNGVVLGHRRLAVIDRSPRSAQPMLDAELGLAVVYNGALYEYRALRDELVALGYRFSTDGDTEVVLKAYHAWGSACVQRLTGMFAFAIVERASGRVFAARDRMGIKPLYWAEGAGWLRLASTLPALVAGGDVDTRIDPAALQQYFTLHGIAIPPHTILRGVRKLPPATTMTIEADGRRHEHAYWTLQRMPDPRPPDAELHERLDAALRTAVRRRLVADREVGILLSGGVDSSLIVALADALGTRPPTFSIGFSSAGGESGSELPWSDAVAARFSTEHHRLVVDTDDTLAAIPDAIAAMPEPMPSHDCVGFFLLSRAVASRLAVVQCGQGADEIFAGYHWYPRLLAGGDPAIEYPRRFFDRDETGLAALLQAPWRQVDGVRAWVAAKLSAPDDRGVRPSAIDAALQIDASVMLPADPLARVDAMTMAWGVEGRVPYLDEDVVALATSIPADRLVAGGGKRILKDVARRYLPDWLVERPKGYFPVPALRWLDGALLGQVGAWLRDPSARTRDLLDRDALESMLSAPRHHVTPLGGSTLWQCAVLEAWLRTHA